MVQYTWQGHSFWVSPQRFIYWEKEKTIVLSDLHLGKTGHFRKAGIAMPQQVYKEDLQRLFSMLQQLKPNRLIIVGDMVHSSQNKELDWFTRWRHDFSHINFTLIKGNHDILKDAWYDEHKIEVFNELQLDNLMFVHDNKKLDVGVQTMDSGGKMADGSGQITTKSEQKNLIINLPTTNYQPPTGIISGHLHPGVVVRGVGKQAMQLPCFCFSENFLLLPAYSKFTGLFTIKPSKQDAVFLIVGDKVVRV